MTPVQASSPQTNNIAIDQVRPEAIDLLRARDRVYGYAKILQGVFVLVMIVIGVLGSVVSADHKPIFGLLGIFALLTDVIYLESHIKRLCKLGAQLGEEFDIKVLNLSRNQFIADRPVAPEDVRRYSAELLHADRERQLHNWYEPQVGQVPLAIGRLICQRTNINYDARLRTSYAARVLQAVLPLMGGLLIACLTLGMSLEATVSLISSLLPVLNWVARDLRKNVEATSQLEKLRSEFDRLWARALDGAMPDELSQGSRRLQDAIFQHRGNTTLITDCFYQRMRSKSEDEAGAAAKRLIEEARTALI
ncbi:S-4TM family putative pore-forming effector [Polaromonas sp. JS666]|uniref:S-4TM family putative pore-forming effector n=1 Tax=Polaromonas sp. (strain JS666 / ATCC BAA-500) TaxID=296591 RepID=UPI0009449102|nr:S-4TM family putative pore-forming effector [Polaromonas sp. JS666]